MSAGDNAEWRLLLFKQLNKTLTPLYADKYENIQHAMSKARLSALLKQHGYFVTVEKPMPTNDTIDLTYVHPFRVDVYAEYIDPYAVSKYTGSFERVPVDKMVIEIGGLDTYHSKSRYAKRVPRKKEMICEQYGIKPERYFIVDKDEIYSKKYMLDESELIVMFGLKRNDLQGTV